MLEGVAVTLNCLVVVARNDADLLSRRSGNEFPIFGISGYVPFTHNKELITMPSLFGTYGQPKKKKKEKPSFLAPKQKSTFLAPTTAQRSTTSKTQGSARAKRGRIRSKIKAKTKNSLANFDREYAPDEQIRQKDAARIAQSVGLPGKTYGQIAIGESSLKPAAESPRPNDPGKGLWQMTANVQSPATQKKWKEIEAEHKGGALNPVANARMAKYLAGEGTGTGNYYGDQYVTDFNASAKPLGDGPSKKLIKRGKKYLGKDQTKKLLKGSSAPKPDTGPSKKAKGKHIVNSQSDKVVAEQLGVKEKRAKMQINKLDPALQTALVRLGRKSGEPVSVNEGFRTTYRQTELAEGRGGATGPAAAPGTSRHEFGNAADLNLTAKQRSLLGAVGLSNGGSGSTQVSGRASTGGTSSGGATKKAKGAFRKKKEGDKKKKEKQRYSDDGYYTVAAEHDAKEDKKKKRLSDQAKVAKQNLKGL